ncbi:MAG: cellulose-binding protein CttA-related protein, partial [Ruminococcus sp.]|nr:cellulose-binding protein CttA-related protein [Ruminococcus sp.]
GQSTTVSTTVSNPGQSTTSSTTVSNPDQSTTSSTATTTTTGPVAPGVFTTTTKYAPVTGENITWTKATTENGYLYSVATIETKVGFYFSHDKGIRALGDKTGFSPDQVTKLVITDVYADGTTKVRPEASINKSSINFGVATPALVYGERTHGQNKSVTIDDFKYTVPVWYENTPLVNEKGEALEITVYIGVKGDITLNNIVDAVDASAVLSYYAEVQTSNGTAAEAKNKTKANTDKSGLQVSSADDILDHFAAFLADVDQDEYDATNWSKMKSDRTVNAVDASYILSFYSEKQTSDKDADAIWKEVLKKN